ncbi:ATP-binding protein [Modestobacter lapidis]|nr:ATP-binding protein [Modestobacter lapidis]
MTGDPARLRWPSSAPPPATGGWNWEFSHVSELPRARAQLRAGLAAASDQQDPAAAELNEAVVLAFDEMASNALRHGGGGVRARVQPAGGAWLVEVCDEAPTRPPQPAIGRDPSQGGLGLYLIAEMSDAHGWHLEADTKSVWALLPRR